MDQYPVPEGDRKLIISTYPMSLKLRELRGCYLAMVVSDWMIMLKQNKFSLADAQFNFLQIGV